MMVTSGRIHSSRGASSNGKKWGDRLSDPEAKRKKRVIKYKVYTMEGKVKASFRKGFYWIKNKVSNFVHGY
ncbi:3-(3-hydroxy-phenyl)propionate/3-hydroxycinnamic acid hydroxylase [Bienertia sinuspersici]